MKNLIVSVFVLLCSVSFAQSDSISAKETPAFAITEEMPSFPGGANAMMGYIHKHIQYPQEEMEAGISGTCYITFVVEKDGTLTGVKILKEIPGAPGCSKEAIRLVQAMPLWSPGKQDGAPVRVQFNLPVKFVLK